MLRTPTSLFGRDPPGVRRIGTRADARDFSPAMRLPDRSHAPTNRTRDPPDHIRRQSVTGRSFTGLTATFSRPAENPLEPWTGSDPEHIRPVLRATVGRRNLHQAHHPGGAGAGAGSALTRPSGAAALAQRSSLGRSQRLLLRALRTVASGRPVHLTQAARHCDSRRGVDPHGEWHRFLTLGPSGSVATDRSAAVQGAASHHVRALGEHVIKSVRSEQVWAFDHAQGVGVLGIDARGNCAPLTDDLRRN